MHLFDMTFGKNTVMLLESLTISNPSHRILTACLRVHISYRTHPRAQISLQREGGWESERRESIQMDRLGQVLGSGYIHSMMY